MTFATRPHASYCPECVGYELSSGPFVIDQSLSQTFDVTQSGALPDEALPEIRGGLQRP